MINLDTHIVVAVLKGTLTARERATLEADPAWGMASIVFWELAMLTAKKRIAIDVTERELREALSVLFVFPITFELARMSCEFDFNGDPADRMIVATSVVHDVPLMTRDTTIRKSGLVRLA